MFRDGWVDDGAKVVRRPGEILTRYIKNVPRLLGAGTASGLCERAEGERAVLGLLLPYGCRRLLVWLVWFGGRYDGRDLANHRWPLESGSGPLVAAPSANNRRRWGWTLAKPGSAALRLRWRICELGG
jgi:hypothetical protein